MVDQVHAPATLMQDQKNGGINGVTEAENMNRSGAMDCTIMPSSCVIKTETAEQIRGGAIAHDEYQQRESSACKRRRSSEQINAVEESSRKLKRSRIRSSSTCAGQPAAAAADDDDDDDLQLNQVEEQNQLIMISKHLQQLASNSPPDSIGSSLEHELTTSANALGSDHHAESAPVEAHQPADSIGGQTNVPRKARVAVRVRSEAPMVRPKQ
jgi:hypothetical protein